MRSRIHFVPAYLYVCLVFQMSFEEGDLMPLTSSEDYYDDQMETKSNSSGHECHPNGTLVYPAHFGDNVTHHHASQVSKN